MSNPRILIAEDELIVAEDVAASLGARGYEIVGMAVTGAEAIEKTRNLEPDLILMDVRLKGGMDGIEAATEIRKEIDIPIIYVSAYAERDILERAKLTDPYGYVLKPFGERDLNKTVEMALYKHEMDQNIKRRSQELALTVERLEDEVARRREVEKRLTEREARFSRYFHLPVVGMATVAKDLTLASVNDKLCRMLGTPMNALIGKKLMHITDPIDYSSEIEYINRLLEGGLETYTMEKTFIGLNGLKAPALTSVGAVRKEDGSVDHFVALMQDMTRLFNEREDSEKNFHETMNLLKAVCDGLQGPVSNVYRFSTAIRELAMESGTKENAFDVDNSQGKERLSASNIVSKIHECADHVAVAGGEIQKYSGALLDYIWAKTSAPIMSKICLQEMLTKIHKDLAENNETFELVLRIASSEFIVAEARTMENLVSLLIRNAIQTVDPKGDLAIQASLEKYSHRSKLLLTTNGISPKSSRPSKGLNYSNTNSLYFIENFFAEVWANRIGASIGSETNEDQLMVFYLELPFHPPSGLRILIVEDNEVSAKLLARHLTALGHQVISCLSAEKAMEVLQSQQLDLVIGDLGMPGMDGWELGKMIIDHCESNGVDKVAYIVLTGWIDYPDQQEKIKESGVDKILHKPADIEDILRAMAEVMELRNNKTVSV